MLMKREYLLSICMMVKNEEKNLERCLDALKPLLEKNDVELIIVDTGSEDNTVGIASQYTDKLYFHKWENHFANMRNITISYANGEFVFILDADEVVVDPLGLYEIINRQKQLANTFTVKIKNLDARGYFSMAQQARIFRNDDDFCYTGAVHNQPKYKAPVIDTAITLDHYGYLFNDKELRERKFQRTAGILKAELEKNPDNIYYRFQLAKSYGAHGDIREALEEIRKAYSLVSGDHDLCRNFILIFGTYAMICLKLNEFEEAARICRQGLELEPEYIDLYYMMAYSLNRTGRKDEALEVYIKYIDLVNRYDDLRITTDPKLEFCYISPLFKDEALYYIANRFYDQGRYEEAYDYSLQITDKDRKTSMTIRTLLRLGRFDELRRTVYSGDFDGEEIQNVLAIIEWELQNLNDGEKHRLWETFSGDSDVYSALNRCRLHRDDCNEAEEIIRKTDFENLPAFYAELFTYGIANLRAIISAFKKMSRSRINKYVKVMLGKKRESGDILADHVLSETVRDNDYSGQKVLTGISYVLLSNQAQVYKNIIDGSFEKYYMIFKKYVLYGIKMMGLLYNGERLRLIYSTLDNDEDRFFIAMKFAGEAVEKGDLRSGMNYFREALHYNPHMACYMERYKDELFQSITG